MDLSRVHQLILSGGGILGYSYIGILKYLEEIQFIKQIDHIIGCSAGAIFATLIALGCSSDELYTALIDISPISYFTVSFANIMALPINKGIDPGDAFIDKLKDLIAIKTLQPDISFAGLYARTGIYLEIGVTNISTLQFELCSHITTPHMVIHQALRASIAIPFLLYPVKLGDHLYCDGGLTNNYPIDRKLSETETIGIYLTNTAETTVSNADEMSMIDYIEKIFKCASNIIPVLQQHKDNTIIIEIPKSVATGFNLLTNKHNILNCINTGYHAIKSHLD